MSKATKVLAATTPQAGRATQDLLPLVYDQLRRLAAARMLSEKPGQTLQATALVHEAWLKLAQGGGSGRWNNRTHFFATAAEAMRQILIDNARRKRAVRHGGGLERVGLENVEIPEPARDQDELLMVHEALDGLAAVHARKAELVKLRFFLGFSFAEAAEVLGISEGTAKRDWAFARAWLYREAKAKPKLNRAN